MHSDDQIVELGARALYDSIAPTEFTYDDCDTKEEVRKEIRAILAALREAGLVFEQGWRFDMENAPRDGTWLLLYGQTATDKTRQKVCRWDADLGEWTGGTLKGSGTPIRFAQPTAWRPLPTPPATGGENGNA